MEGDGCVICSSAQVNEVLGDAGGIVCSSTHVDDNLGDAGGVV